MVVNFKSNRVKEYKTKKVEKIIPVAALPLLAGCYNSSNERDTVQSPINKIDNETTNEPVVVILDFFQTNTSHGPQVLKNFYGEFLSDSKEVTVIAEDVDPNKSPGAVLRVFEDFNPDVVNVSWGWNIDTFYPYIGEYEDHDPGVSGYINHLEDIQTLYENGVTITASAGNDGTDGATNATFANSIFPIVVGAYSQYDNKIYDWSDQGSAMVHFYEAGDGWGKLGTSYAAPRVAAHVATIKSEYPDISESSVRTLLEKNSLYDFDGGKYVQKLDELDNTMDTSIDTRVKVESVFEIFEGRNPSQTELDTWIELVDNGDETLGSMAMQFAINGVQTDDIPPIERMQAFYHFWLDRESRDSEIVDMFDDLAQTQDWNKTFDNFIETENVDTNYSFVYNNYDALTTEAIA